MSSPGRTPPRFVPTLTTVVEASSPASVPAPPAPLADPLMSFDAADAIAAMEVVEEFGLVAHHPTPHDAPALPAPASSRTAQTGPAGPGADTAALPLPARAAPSEADLFRIEEDLLHRVLQRVDLSLESRLGEAVGEAVRQQLETMLPRLRGEIETVLRALVIEALAEELSADHTGSAPGSAPRSLG